MRHPQGDPDTIKVITLEDDGMKLALLNLGATTQGWWYEGVPLILGYDDPLHYLGDTSYLGAIVGRVANRVAGAQFHLQGQTFTLDANEGPNTLHGGAAGLSNQYWQVKQLSDSEAALTYLSPDGEGGFPGAVRFEIHVCLDCPRLIYTITAQPDRPTPISIAQHNYYTLGHRGDISEHTLSLAAGQYLEIDDAGIPTGVVKDATRPMDFSAPQALRGVPDGIDHYFCFDPDRQPSDPIATLASPDGLRMRVYSDQSGAQIYTGEGLSDPFFSRAGMCIEPSGYPNAPNTKAFPSVLSTPSKPYHQRLVLDIAEGAT